MLLQRIQTDIVSGHDVLEGCRFDSYAIARVSGDDVPEGDHATHLRPQQGLCVVRVFDEQDDVGLCCILGAHDLFTVF